MQTDQPFISVVTISYNDKEALEQTIQSVILQTYDNMEYIVIDGGSTDGTVEVIKRYQSRIEHWVSEEDRGISDAFNKGILQAKDGGYILMLNAGDTFLLEESLSSIAEYLDEEIVSFQIKTPRGLVLPRQYSFANALKENDLTALLNYIESAHLFHQATFVKKSVYLEVGMYDLSYKIRMDLDFLLRAIKEHRVKFVKKPVVLYLTDGISSQLSNRLRFKLEEKRAVCALVKEKCTLYKLYFYTMLPFYLMKKTLSALKYAVADRKNR